MIESIKLSRAPLAALAAIGLFWGAFAATFPAFKEQIGASDGAFGLALVMSAVGGIAAMLLAPRAGRLFGRRLLPIGACFIALSMIPPLGASSVIGFGAAIFFTGLAMSLLDISVNVRISVLEERHGLHLMNLNHAMFSFAFAAAAFGAGLARQAGATPAMIMPVVALGVLLLAALTWEQAGRYRAADDTPDPTPARTPWLAIGLTGCILFAAFIGENATEAWSALLIERTLGGAAGEGGFGPAMLGLTMGIGRLAGQVVAQRLGEARLILLSALLGVVGASVIGSAPTPNVVLLGVAIMGFGMAVIVPSATSILGKLVRNDQRTHAISRAWMLGMAGFFAGPAMMGLVSQMVGLRGAFFVVAAVVALIVPAVLTLKARGGGAQPQRPAKSSGT